MNNEIIQELKNAIEELKLDILDKQEQLNLLLNQYQQLTGVEFENKENIEN